jgi:hypothetical protein
MSDTHRPTAARSRRLAVALLALATLAASLLGPVGPPPAGAASPTTDGPTAAGYAAGWLAAKVTAEGFVPNALGDPSPADTLGTSLALVTAGVEPAAFARTVGWLAANVDAVTGTGADVLPGSVGELLVVIDSAGEDPTDFGGVDLIARLGDSLGAFEPGLYGAGDPTYDGVYRQSLSVIGLVAAGEAVPQAAVDWLEDQQCGGSDPTIRGGWEAYRHLADACTAGSTVTFDGVDSNSTALAASALSALGLEPAFDPIDWFAAVQNSTGGWGYLQGLDDDPNSTSVVIQAITALGADAAGPAFTQAGGSPLPALLGFQLGCDADPADQGAFTYPGSDDAPNLLATEQAVWGAMPRTFPLGTVAMGAAPVPCQAPTEPTTSTTNGSGSNRSDAAPAADAVATTASFTG